MSAMLNAEDSAEERAAIGEEFRFRMDPAEIKQRKKNKARFQIIRSVIELQSFTISEINELTRILVNKKRTCEQEGLQMMQSQNSGGPSRKVRPLPLPENVLRKIFSLAQKKEIFSYRLVCRDWSSAGAMELRSRICKFLDFYGGHAECLPDSGIPKDDLDKFLLIMSKSQLLPVNSFLLNMKWPRSSLHFCLIKNFYQMFGPILEYLSLDFSNYLHLNTRRSWRFKTHLNGVNLEKLRTLRVKFGDYKKVDDPIDLSEGNRTSFTCDYFARAQNLQKLHFESDKNSVELVRSLEKSRLRHLNTLVLESSTLYDKELRHLGRAVNLKNLSLNIKQIGFKTETMKGFLQSQSKLEYLKIFSYEGNTEFLYEFPRMESLKIFSIASQDYEFTLRFAPFDWNLSFPKLEEFQMGEGLDQHWRESLFHPDSKSVHLGLKTIDFPMEFGTRLKRSLPVISRIFPNIQIVKMWVEDLFYPIPTKWFPNLYRIVVRTFEGFDAVEAKTFMKNFAWGLPLGPGEEDCEVQDLLKCVDRVTEFAFDLNYMERENRIGTETVRRIHDCTSFLKLLRERIKLQQIKEELQAEAELKKKVSDLSLDSDSDDDIPSNSTTYVSSNRNRTRVPRWIRGVSMFGKKIFKMNE